MSLESLARNLIAAGNRDRELLVQRWQETRWLQVNQPGEPSDVSPDDPSNDASEEAPVDESPVEAKPAEVIDLVKTLPEEPADGH